MSHELAFVFLKHDDFAYVLFEVALVLAVARGCGWLFTRLGQPAVIGEVIGGIALGPSLLGAWSADLFPVDSRPFLKVLATLGVVLFMFLVGIELEVDHLRGRLPVAGGVALAGTVIPFGMGMALATVLYPDHGNGTGAMAFHLFVGAAMSITAFPVLVRILQDRKLLDTPLGAIAVGCAALDDVLTWATLALVVALISSSSALDLPYVVGLSVLFVAAMFGLVRPFLERFADREADAVAISFVVIGVLLSAYVTSAIGIHEIFGAFLFGAVFPRGRLADGVRHHLFATTVVLLPVFFVTTGLNVDIGAVSQSGLWQGALILVVAFTGKFVGGIVGAQMQRLPARESLALGALMNTRGLAELIVLNIGLQLGVLDTELFTLFVIMAVITTVATGPLLAWIKPDPYLGAAVPTRPSTRRVTPGDLAPEQL